MFLAYNTRALPGQPEILLDLLATRQEIAGILGFAVGPPGHGGPDDGSRPTSYLPDKVECGQPGRSRREHELIVNFAREPAAGLDGHRHGNIDASSRGYWYEQFGARRLT